MSVAILIEFKAPDREELYIPVAAQGVYSTEWVPMARKLGLKWLPLFRTGSPVDVEDLPTVVDEIRQLRAALSCAIPTVLACPAQRPFFDGSGLKATPSKPRRWQASAKRSVQTITVEKSSNRNKSRSL